MPAKQLPSTIPQATFFQLSIRIPGNSRWIPFGYVETFAKAQELASKLGEYRQGNSFAAVSIKPLSGEFDE